MKQISALISILAVLLSIAFFGGYLFGEKNAEIKTKIVTKIDTVETAYADTVFKFVAQKHIVRDTVFRDVVRVVVDTLRDTVFVVYSAPFKIGADTLNCTGNVYFDMRDFYFDKVKFHYPQRTITKIKFVEKTNWTWVAVGAAVGVVIGAVAK